jgi:methionine aminopeptidase
VLQYDDVMKLDFGTHIDGNSISTSCLYFIALEKSSFGVELCYALKGKVSYELLWTLQAI